MKTCARLTCCCVLFCASLSLARAASDLRLYIGVYTKTGSRGIYMTRFDPSSGRLTPAELAVEASGPSFLAQHPSKPVLYAVNEDSGKVSAFRIAPDSGKLTLLNQWGSGGAGPCHLAVDATGQMLVVANYGGGSIATFLIAADGSLGARKQFIQFAGSGPNQQRQEGPHAHSATFTGGNRLLLVDDLGTDKTMIYRVDPHTASLRPNQPPFASAEAGAGPRHLVVDPQQRFVYVLNEIQSSITQFSFDAATGTLRPGRTVSALPPDFKGASTSAEIALDQSGKTLYASNRGSDSLSVFAVDSSTGALRLIQNVPSGGKTPRHFALDPSGRWLIAANQDSGNLTVFRVDEQSGKLNAQGSQISVAAPVCVLFPKAASR